MDMGQLLLNLSHTLGLLTIVGDMSKSNGIVSAL